MARAMGPMGTQSRGFWEAVRLQWGFLSKPGSPKSSASLPWGTQKEGHPPPEVTL